jgi:hypothetical protein
MATIEITLSPEEASRFLDLVINDEQFRERLQADPESVLRESGIEVPPELVSHFMVPPSDDLNAALRDPEMMQFSSCLIYGIVYLAATISTPPSTG